MVKEAGFLFSNGWFRPHCGIHLGLWRKKRKTISNEVWQLLGKEAYKSYYEFYNSLKSDSLYKEIRALVLLREIDNMEKFLNCI